MATVIGLNAKLYFGTAGSTASTELTNVKDVTLNLECGEADVTTRASEGWKVSVATLKDASVEFTMLYDTENAGYSALKTAYFGGTPIALLIADDDENGLDADFTITGFSIEQPLEDAVTVSITAKPTFKTRAPEWV